MYNLLDLPCKNQELLNRAFTHPSYTRDLDLEQTKSYERLEFLGDAVLKLTISKLLYEKYPSYLEGELSKIRSILVSDAELAKVAEQIGIPDKMLLSPSEESAGGKHRTSNIACAFEAMLGAYYLDDKFVEIEAFIKEHLLPLSDDIVNNFVKYNAKAVLQEYTQKENNIIPEYKTLEVSGPKHKPIFEVSVSYNNEELARATGHSKKEAQQNCAYKACVKLGLVKNEDI